MPPQRKRKAEEPPEEPGSEEGSEPSLSEEDGSDSSFPTEGSDDPAADAAQDDDEGYEDDEEDVKEITVEFQFFEPQEIDFLGLKTLLAGYLNGEQYDSSGLIDAIITDVSEQAAVWRRCCFCNAGSTMILHPTGQCCYSGQDGSG
jgi:hypothetical protein